MYCYRKVTEDLYYVGGDDRRAALFEGVYKIPNGVSYNSYLLKDEKNVLFDTVDPSVAEVFFENIAHLLDGEKLDYVVVHHMEPDHSATLKRLMEYDPDAVLVVNAKIAAMIGQFFDCDTEGRLLTVKENDTLSCGRHELSFIFAPLVHWPEVMFSYDKTDHILFSADAFGTFGALDGAIFADEADFEKDYLDEARRYYTNIVGKYGVQVQNALKKAAGLEIAMVCPLHGFVWRKNFDWYLGYYQKWSTYTPEENGVVIAYGSIYGHTANAANILASELRERGIRAKVFDLSVTPAADVLAAAFRYSHLVLASATYNAGAFVKMEDLLHDLAAHNFQNRKVAFIENGSWAPGSAKAMGKILEGCKKITVMENTVTFKSALKEEQRQALVELAGAIAEDF